MPPQHASRPLVASVLTLVRVCAIVAALLFLRGDPTSQLSAQAQTITARPLTYTAATFGNPQNAIDASDASASGAALGRVCSQTCTTPTSAGATWGGFLEGYRPIRLEVHWIASATMALFGTDAGEVDVVVEYNLGSGWNVRDTYTWTANSPNCPGDSSVTCTDHVASVPLTSDQSSGAIQVRGTLTVKLTHCDNCGLRVSNVHGSMSVYDIRLIANPPTLKVSSSPAVRGDSVTFTVDGAPGATISRWHFDTDQLGTVTRQTNLSDSSWSGKMLVAGTAGVHVVVTGVAFDLSAAVDVTPRTWTDAPVSPVEVPNGTIATLVSPPSNNSMIGATLLDIEYVFTPFQLADDGPNDGLWYVTTFSDNSTYQYEISPDAENSSSTFYVAQCGDYDPATNPSGFISGAVLLSNVREHESGTVKGHYQQYAAAVTEPQNDLAAGAEQEIGPAGTTQQGFQQQVLLDLNNRGAAIQSATASEACNHDTSYDTTCTFRGYVNFVPYTSCR